MNTTRYNELINEFLISGSAINNRSRISRNLFNEDYVNISIAILLVDIMYNHSDLIDSEEEYHLNSVLSNILSESNFIFKLKEKNLVYA